MPFYGANVGNVTSEYLRAWIQSEEAGVTVVGLIGEGTTKELVANWESPFQDMSLGGAFRTAGGMAQIGTGLTSQTILNSHQVWAGNEPYTFSLVLKFLAMADANHEVERPILELEKMMAPDLNPKMPGGRAPGNVGICIGNHWVMKNCVIKSMSVPIDKERDQFGRLVRADVALQVETIEVITKKELQASTG
jgi:hypothetical protein